MALRSLAYATTGDFQDTRGALDAAGRLEALLERWLSLQRIAGYRLVTGLIEEDYDDYGLNRELIESVTGGALPFIALSVTFERESPDLESGLPPGLAAVLREHNFREMEAPE